MKPRLILHIGTHKTGTTTLQALMAAQRPALAAAGICYPDTTRSSVPHLPKHSSLFEALVDGPDAFAREHALITGEFDRSGAHTLVLSEEGLSGPRHGDFGAMARFAGDFDITVVCVLRRQDRLAEALWNQYCREGHEKAQIEAFVARPRVLLRLDYLRMLTFWQGIGTVRALSYDDLVRGAGLVAGFAAATGLPLSPQDDRRENVSPSMACASVLADLNRRGEAGDWHEIERALGPTARRTALGGRLRRDLLARFAGVNAALDTRFGVRFDGTLPDEPDTPLPGPAAPAYLSEPAPDPAATFSPRVIEGLLRLHRRSGTPDWPRIGAALERLGHGPSLRAYHALADVVPQQATALTLRLQSLYLVLAERHDDYEALLRACDPGLRLRPNPVTHRSFAGSGTSGSALLGYRRLDGPSGARFEKIYFRDTPGMRRTGLVHGRFAPELARIAHLPALCEVAQGSQFAQHLFEFVDLSRAAPADPTRRLALACALADLRLRPDPSDAGLAALLDYRRQDRLTKAWRRLVRMLSTGQPDRDAALRARLERVAAAIAGLPRQLAHGDLAKPGNVYAGDVLLDWDMCCLAPFGHDAGWVLTRAHSDLSPDAVAEALAAMGADQAGDAGERLVGLMFFVLVFQGGLGRPRPAPAALSEALLVALEGRLGV
ncbi:phosphotransferase [Rhodobaculum claviforme]|uniref:Aminoglycoside phosphotransferase domain-containing protein n=1 Tax=Rhodobaculum claviforme TaxID=1549854 RepID=A0A934TMN8_9RHOB|nr:phosphotransferase [Rhodobaculum claviforme]MBK5928448.1 hypothetical protein [Rhodobaculum claviforme]